MTSNPLRLAISLCVGLLALACTERQTDTDIRRPPNIIVVLADDLGLGDLHAYDPESVIPTPNIDRLAEQGIRFTDAHSPSSVCTPSRYGILTGRYAWRTSLQYSVLRYFDPPLINASRITLPGLLRRSGYATAAVGKWHLGLNVPARVDDESAAEAGSNGLAHGGIAFARPKGRYKLPDPDFSAAIHGGPLDRGFDSYFGAQLNRVRAFVRGRHFVGTPVHDESASRFVVPGWDESQKGPRELAEALARIERFHGEQPDRPFFLYFAAQSPHAPYAPPDQIAGIPVAGTSGAGARGDLVVELDVMVGQLANRLEDLGIAQDTLLIVTSDNGAEIALEGLRVPNAHDPSRGWRGKKGTVYEAGHRVPFIARWGDGSPDGSVIVPGSTSDQLIGLQDLMATLAEVVGAPLPADAAEDSESFLSALMGRPLAEPGRNHLVHHSRKGRFAIRRGDWKLVLPLPARQKTTEVQPAGELYNLASDPQEANDRYSENSTIVTELTALLDRDRRAGRSAKRLD